MTFLTQEEALELWEQIDETKPAPRNFSREMLYRSQAPAIVLVRHVHDLMQEAADHHRVKALPLEYFRPQRGELTKAWLERVAFVSSPLARGARGTPITRRCRTSRPSSPRCSLCKPSCVRRESVPPCVSRARCSR